MGEPPALSVGEVLHQTQQCRVRDDQSTAKLLVIEPLDLLEHTRSLEVEEGQGGVQLASVVAGHVLPLCLEHGARITSPPAATRSAPRSSPPPRPQQDEVDAELTTTRRALPSLRAAHRQMNWRQLASS
jgi:hypothetical protein